VVESDLAKRILSSCLCNNDFDNDNNDMTYRNISETDFVNNITLTRQP